MHHISKSSLIWACSLFLLHSLITLPPLADQSQSCANSHAKEYKDWQGSHLDAIGN